MPEKPAGKVEHYYPKVQAAAVRLTKKVKLGDQVHIVGHGDDFKEKVTSLQVDREPIQEGKPGQSVGLWVKERVHEGDDVLLVTPSAAKPKGRKAAKQAKKAAPKSKAAKKAPRKAAKKAKKSKAKAKKASRKKSARAKPRKATKKRR
ncbi:MAG: hypothetical protein WC876_09790 [Candidatus Thermoplasmatota archaeon]